LAFLLDATILALALSTADVILLSQLFNSAVSTLGLIFTASIFQAAVLILLSISCNHALNFDKSISAVTSNLSAIC
jgi:hypothetical protein